jgi:hypothetical protein
MAHSSERSGACSGEGKAPLRAGGAARGGRLLVVVATGILLFGCAIWWWDGAVDDAFVSFRYSQNLVDGLGPVYNAGERIEGYSNPSWVLILAAAIAVGFDPVSASKLIAVVSGIALLVLLYAGLRRAAVRAPAAGLPVLLLAASAQLQMASVSGSETVLYALLLFGGLLCLVGPAPSRRAVFWASACLAVASLTRPEGVMFWLAGFLVTQIWGRTSAQRSPAVRLRRALSYALPGIAIALHWAWRFFYYGDLLPNLYYAKTGGGRAAFTIGLSEVGQFLTNPSHFIWVLLAALGGWVGAYRSAGRRRAAIMAGAILMQILCVLVVGGDIAPGHRFYVPVLAPLAYLFGLLFLPGMRAYGPAGYMLGRLGTIGAPAAVVLGLWYAYSTYLPTYERLKAYQAGNIKLGRYLAENRTPDTVIATSAAGAIPFYSRLRTIDSLGLNDRHIARRPFPDIEAGGLRKWDADYVVSLGPDLIVIHRGYIVPGDPRAGRVASEPRLLISDVIDVDLFNRVDRSGDYSPKALDFGDGSVFWIFEKN